MKHSSRMCSVTRPIKQNIEIPRLRHLLAMRRESAIRHYAQRVLVRRNGSTTALFVAKDTQLLVATDRAFSCCILNPKECTGSSGAMAAPTY